MDDSKKGGDIDLYIIPTKEHLIFEKQMAAKIKLEDLLYKPVDIVIAKDQSRLIEKEALLKGILL